MQEATFHEQPLGYISHRQRFWVRTVLIALVLLAPLYYMFVRYGVEPWPTYMMPRFGGGAGEPAHFALKDIVAVTPTGERVPVSWEDMFGLPGGVARTVAAQNFSPRAKPPATTRVESLFSSLFGYYPFSNYAGYREGQPHGNDPETRRWLQDHLAERYPGMTFDRVEFVWYDFDGYIQSSEVPPDATAEIYVVQLP
jgi:hypothetical protein